MKEFFDEVRSSFGPLSQSQVDGMILLLAASATGSINTMPVQHRAYILATAWHETAATMQPITERGPKKYFDKYEPSTKLGRVLGNTLKGDGYLFRGRGYVQVTGRRNYNLFSHLLNTDLVANPDFALQGPVAAQIILRGMVDGLFTGKKMRDFSNYRDMRRAVNGIDKSVLISGYADRFEIAIFKQLRANEAAAKAAQQSTPTSFKGQTLMADTTEVAVINSPASSKINWTQIAALIAGFGAYFGLNLDPATLAAALLGIGSVAQVLTIIWRTWFMKKPAAIG